VQPRSIRSRPNTLHAFPLQLIAFNSTQLAPVVHRRCRERRAAWRSQHAPCTKSPPITRDDLPRRSLNGLVECTAPPLVQRVESLKESLRGKTPSIRIPPRTPTPPPTQHLQSIHERYPSAHTRTRGDTRSPSPSTPICGAGVALTGLTSRATSARYHQPPRPSTPPKLRCITPPHGAACTETPAERGMFPVPGATRRRMRVEERDATVTRLHQPHAPAPQLLASAQGRAHKGRGGTRGPRSVWE
jgi:hypothetical protein